MQKTSVFLLNPNNTDILTGGRRTPTVPGKLSPGLKWFLIICVAFYLVLSITGVIWMVTELVDWYALNTQGVTVEGQLTGRDTDTIMEQDQRFTDPNRRTIYYWEYTYTTLDGQMFEGRAQVNEDAYSAYTFNMPVQVQYLEVSPNISQLVEENAFTFPRIAVFAGGGNGLLMTFVILSGWLEFRKNRLYKRDGRIIDGWVVNPKLQVGESEGKRVARLYLNYRIISPETGQDIHRIQDQQRNDLTEADLPPEGSRLAVLYVNDRLFTVL